MSAIDFGGLGGPVYVGRPNGEKARERLDLDKLDEAATPIDVLIPEGTYSVTSSYFLGLFGPSVVHFASEEAFFTHYVFRGPAKHIESAHRNAERALREQGVLKLA
jgi:hypothetical protein